jgi:hypothetical protein
VILAIIEFSEPPPNSEGAFYYLGAALIKILMLNAWKLNSLFEPTQRDHFTALCIDAGPVD